eukprot:6196651-Pleurochrysis_carterae.AAC.5
MSAARASGTTRTSAALSAAAMSDETGVGGADQSVRECARAEAAERDDGFAGVLLAALSGCIAAQGAEAVAAAIGADSPLLTLETHALWVRAKIRAFGAKDPRVWRQDPRVWHVGAGLSCVRGRARAEACAHFCTRACELRTLRGNLLGLRGPE